ncbi:hypothetical protein BT67DRAFT_51520 [Trichocladium antarcticum]|uniref:Uncharacterized protein n=1 Tax=Trichocladium antarcticum TaxID=1450529 RepID=A0AAN6UI76_9PEZI|nr:hypothetical protein BT67DRAFT_51520 [Trichocladium antarcticum]
MMTLLHGNRCTQGRLTLACLGGGSRIPFPVGHHLTWPSPGEPTLLPTWYIFRAAPRRLPGTILSQALSHPDAHPYTTRALGLRRSPTASLRPCGHRQIPAGHALPRAVGLWTACQYPFGRSRPIPKRLITDLPPAPHSLRHNGRRSQRCRFPNTPCADPVARP